MRRKGVVLVARKGCEYWFIDSVFWHDADLYGCTGSTVYPVSEEQAEDALSVDQLEDRFGDYWRERVEKDVQGDCENCASGPDEDGCEDCGYQSLRGFCTDIATHDGYDAVFDYPGCEFEEILRDLLVSDDDPDCVETVDCSGGGRILAAPVCYSDFDEVYNSSALKACLDYEGGAISYDDAVRIIFGD